MKYSLLLLPLAAISLVSSPAFAAESHAQKQAEHHVQQQDASIPFANYGGIWDWRTHGDQTIYFEDNNHQWYRARLFYPAFDLPYVNFIGIDARPNGTLNKWSAVYIHGQRYGFSSFKKVNGPPSGKHDKASKNNKP